MVLGSWEIAKCRGEPSMITGARYDYGADSTPGVEASQETFPAHLDELGFKKAG